MAVQAETVYWYILAGFGFIVLAALVCFLYYVNYLHEKNVPKKERPIDPMMKAFIMALAWLALLAFVNIFEKGFFKRWWYTGPVLFVIILTIYMVILRRRLPLDVFQQYDKCKEVLRYFYDAVAFKGMINYPPIEACRTTRESGRDNVANWLIPMEAGGNKEDFYIQLDKISKEVLTIDMKPDSAVKEAMHGKAFPAPPKPISTEFGTIEGEEEEEKPVESERKE